MVNAKSFPIYKRFCRPLNTASASAGAALHAAAKLVANGISRSALAVFSGRQNLL